MLKEAAQSELVDAVHAAAAGRTYVNPHLGARLVTLPPPPPRRRRRTRRAELAIGSTFAGHRIDAIAGRGGMGVVYRATDLTLDRPVALKLLVPSAGRGSRLPRALRARVPAGGGASTIRTSSRSSTRARSAGRSTSPCATSTGPTCGRSSPRSSGSSRRARSRIVAQVAAALTEAHRHGLVHRDVKPANILIATRDGREHAFLTDFGITMDRVAERRSSRRPGSRSAPPTTWRPSRRRASASTARADIYALGCILYRALTGTVLYEKDSDVEKLWAHIHEPPPALLDVRPELPPSLGDAVERALAKAPATASRPPESSRARRSPRSRRSYSVGSRRASSVRERTRSLR